MPVARWSYRENMFQMYTKILLVNIILIFLGIVGVLGHKEKRILNCTEDAECQRSQYCSPHGCIPYGRLGDVCPCQRKYDCVEGECRARVCSRDAECGGRQCCVVGCQEEGRAQGRCQSLGRAGEFCSTGNTSSSIHSGYCPCKDDLECRGGMCHQRICQKNSDCPQNYCCIRFRCVELGHGFRDACEPKQNYNPSSMMAYACPCVTGFRCSPETEKCERQRCRKSRDCPTEMCCKRRRCRECAPTIEPPVLEIEMDVFSGRPNPKWEVDESHHMFGQLVEMLMTSTNTSLGMDLGYRGFIVKDRTGDLGWRTVGIATLPELETVLLESASVGIQPEVLEHVLESIRGMNTTEDSTTTIPQTSTASTSATTTTPRPNTPTPVPVKGCKLPAFVPAPWNAAASVKINNCYNYANNKMTNTFAQPGRGSGKMHTKPGNAVDVLAATLRDGIRPQAKFNPNIKPMICYIALVIWPNVDFHYYRLDDNKKWSHKPGQTPAINTDKAGKLIADPKTAARGKYTVFVSYLETHTGVTII